MRELTCDSCGKRAEFKVYRASETSRHAVQHLCSICASDLERILCGSNGLPLPNLLNVLAISNPLIEDEYERTSVCPNCGNNVDDVTEAGIVGCPACYEFFRAEVESVIHRLHGR